MFKSIFFAALAASAMAQSITQSASSTVSQSMPAAATAGFNIAQTNATDRQTWCSNQLATCPNICGGRTQANRCDATTLTYTCVCLNGTAPDCSAYQQTIPFFICEATYAQCITDHPNDRDAQQSCTDNHNCGTETALASGVQVSSSSSSGASSSASGSAAATAASSTSSHAAGAMVAPVMNGAFAALLLALWKLAL